MNNKYMYICMCMCCYQTVVKPIAEAFISVTIKDSLYDCYAPNSGQRIGHFKADMPMPWDVPIVDPVGIRKPYRLVPPGLRQVFKK